MVAAPIRTCPSRAEEGAVRVGLHVDAGRMAVCARGACKNDRRNRSVPVSMAAAVGIVGAHNGSHGYDVWLHLRIFACPRFLSHRDASPFFAVFLDSPPDAPCV
jgi:hypothetical protein